MKNIDWFINNGGHVSFGEAGPVRCAAIANDEHQTLVMLARRDNESLPELLVRLDQALEQALEEQVFIDEVNV